MNEDWVVRLMVKDAQQSNTGSKEVITKRRQQAPCGPFSFYAICHCFVLIMYLFVHLLSQPIAAERSCILSASTLMDYSSSMPTQCTRVYVFLVLVWPDLASVPAETQTNAFNFSLSAFVYLGELAAAALYKIWYKDNMFRWRD